MDYLTRLFHRCRYNKKVAVMTYACECGKKRWGLFDEKNH